MSIKHQNRNHDLKAKVLKALAHPTRLLFVEELQKGERCVCELKEMVDADFSTVSKHLSVLKKAGIVNDDKRGLQVYYSLKIPCILSFLHCVESVLESIETSTPEIQRRNTCTMQSA